MVGPIWTEAGEQPAGRRVPLDDGEHRGQQAIRAARPREAAWRRWLDDDGPRPDTVVA